MDKNSVHDNVTNPSHYTQGDIEAKEFIIDQDMTWAIGNATKYLVRYRWKHKGEGKFIKMLAPQKKRVACCKKTVLHLAFCLM